MSLFRLLQSPKWIYGRRLVLIALILFLGYRNYGNSFFSWFRATNAQGDVVITRSEFRPDVGETKPVWIIGLRNQSSKYTYDQIELEATYLDQSGQVIETDKLVVRQKLLPETEQLVGSSDIKNRPGAAVGTLKVLNATRVEP